MDDAGIVDQNVEIAERAAGFRHHVAASPASPTSVPQSGPAEGARLRLAGSVVDVGDRDARTLRE